MTNEITYGQLNGINLKYDYIENIGDVTRTVKVPKQDTPVHPDLKKAFRDIVPHFMLLCEQTTENKAIKEAIMEGMPDGEIEAASIFFPYEVDSFKLTGTGDNEGVVFSGTRILTNGGVLQLTSPKLIWDDDDYKYKSELKNCIEILKEETREYSQGKRAPLPDNPQTGIDFDDMDITVADADIDM